MSAPGSTVTMDHYHAALDRRDRRIAELEARVSQLEAAQKERDAQFENQKQLAMKQASK